jgi:hypothetical protein
MTMPRPDIPPQHRSVLLELALGDYGAGDWDERTEYRFVHKETGAAVAVFDARVHAPLSDWRSERRTVITTRWEPSR